MALLPPSQDGSHLAILMAINNITIENSMVERSPIFMIFLASLLSFAPIRCASWTLKPSDAAFKRPPISQVDEETKPIEAESWAPRRPTILASAYSMMMVDICDMIAGKEIWMVSLIESFRVSLSPFLSFNNNSFCIVLLFLLIYIIQYLPTSVLDKPRYPLYQQLFQ